MDRNKRRSGAGETTWRMRPRLSVHANRGPDAGTLDPMFRSGPGWRKACLAIVLVLAAPLGAAAEAGIQVQPGLWEFRCSLPDPTGGPSQPLVQRTCVRDRTITPDRVMARMKQCRISDAVIQGATAKWKMKCETPLGPMSGRGSLRTNGTAVAGNLDLTMVVGGFEIPATSPFQGRRIGDCR